MSDYERDVTSSGASLEIILRAKHTAAPPFAQTLYYPTLQMLLMSCS